MNIDFIIIIIMIIMNVKIYSYYHLSLSYLNQIILTHFIFPVEPPVPSIMENSRAWNTGTYSVTKCSTAWKNSAVPIADRMTQNYIKKQIVSFHTACSSHEPN